MLKTKIINHFLIVMFLCLAGYGNIFAIPALPFLLEITQPNGAKFKAYQRGDEYFSWWESKKGTVLFRNLESGYFEYAKISFVEENGKLVSTGVIFIAEEEMPISNARVSKMTKFNLGKIWRQKREDARKHLQGILEKQRESVNQ